MQMFLCFCLCLVYVCTHRWMYISKWIYMCPCHKWMDASYLCSCVSEMEAYSFLLFLGNQPNGLGPPVWKTQDIYDFHSI